ncbi:transcription factor MYB56-like [Rhodamnia argentea]|uniref:Transcription factor MYB56-like n=1 Tax=Rhodamnia argentea TaxID=178133 RepID=A0A8B8N753_9MYRT|nr:transcription factor MYB56-like [Rhodamnia argentea]
MSLQHVKTTFNHFTASPGIKFPLPPPPQMVSLAVELEPLRSRAAKRACGDDREGFVLKKGLDLNMCEDEEEEAEEEIDTEEQEQEEEGGAAAKSSGPGRNSGRTKVCARGHWRPAEDAKLKDLVAKYGPQNWNLIAENLLGRSGKSCRLRWFNQLDPRINRRPFSAEEEDRLLASHKLYGNKWAMIARLFPGRTDNAVKNHWHVIVARKQREQSNSACGRRRNHKLLPHLQTRELNDIASAAKMNRACSYSTTMSSNLDSPAVSTCTDLSLTPSSARAPPLIFARPSESRMGSAAKRPVARVEAGSSFSRLCTNNIRAGADSDDRNDNSPRTQGTVTVVEEADHGGASDTNSDASAGESTGIGNPGSLSPVSVETEESRTEDDKIDLPFIDFLGVGAA